MITDLDASIHAHGEYARGRKRGALAAVAVTLVAVALGLSMYGFLQHNVITRDDYVRGREAAARATVMPASDAYCQATAETVYGHDMLALGTNPDQDWVRRHYVPRAEKAFYAGCTFSPSSD